MGKTCKHQADWESTSVVSRDEDFCSVGLVCLHVVGPDGEHGSQFELPGDRETIRGRATAAALHQVRRIVTESAQTRSS